MGNIIKVMRGMKFKRAVLLVVTLCLVASIILEPLKSKALNFSNTLGTNTSLGSPLLNASWETTDWNKYEMVTFGLFLSNFVRPLVDDYNSAFNTKADYGSKGAGIEALKFGSGNDAANNELIDIMIKYCMDASKQSYTPIYTEYVSGGLGVETKTIGSEEFTSKLGNLFPSCIDTSDLAWKANSDNGSLTEKSLGGAVFPHIAYSNNSIDIKDNNYNYNLGAAASYCVPKMYIKDGDKKLTVFDMTNAWDLNIITSIMNQGYREDSNKAFKDTFNKGPSGELYLDAFGNIVALVDSKYVMVVPASCNQYLTKDKQYNMLNYMFACSNYTNASKSKLQTGIQEYTDGSKSIGGLGIADEVSSGIKQGDLIMYQDSASAVVQSISQGLMGKETKSVSGTYAEIKSHLGSLVTTGESIKSVMESSLDTETLTTPDLKFEVVNASTGGFWEDLKAVSAKWVFQDNTKYKLNAYGYGLASLRTLVKMDSSVPILNYMYTLAGKQPLFEDYVYSCPSIQLDEGGSTSSKLLASNILDYADGNNGGSSLISGEGLVEPSEDIYADIIAAPDLKTLDSSLFVDGGGELSGDSVLSPLAQLMLVTHNTKKKGTSIAKLDNLKVSEANSKFESANLEVDQLRKTLRHVVKIYRRSSDMQAAESVFSLKDGTDFSSYSPFIYMTYLEWYGLKPDGTSNFNDSYFKYIDVLNTSAEELFAGKILSQKDKKKQVLDCTYLLLNPSKGESYIQDITDSYVLSFLNSQYRRMALGTATSSKVGDRATSVTSGGFLKISAYSDNFTTSWFIKLYESNILFIMAIMLVIILLFGIISGKKISWYFVSLAIVISSLSLVPSVGEITPYVCNKIVQSIFEDNTGYWAIAENISNSKVESELSSNKESGVTYDSTTQAYIKMLGLTQLDKTIMIKQDISKKIIDNVGIDYGEMQKLQSTQWVLPVLIRQITSSDGSANYLYGTLGDLYDDMSRMYWYYSAHSADKTSSTTLLAQDSFDPDVDNTTFKDNIMSVINKKGLYSNYKNTSNSDLETVINYRSVSRQYDDTTNSHTCFYLLDNSNMKIRGPESKIVGMYSADSFDKFAKKVGKGEHASLTSALSNVLTLSILPKINIYNGYTTGVSQSFGYLWTTESPAHYFYQSIKDTFDPEINLANLVINLEGYYEAEEENQEEYRHSFMHWSKKGEIRDFLDMEELFTNVIPYMYTVQILAYGDNNNGAFSDESGMELLGDEYTLNDKNEKAWMFRSNWVTKLVEYSMYSKDTTVKDKDDKEHKIQGCLFPQNYPAERPMVFSEAQMVEQGLEKSDLSYAEINIIEVNKRVETKWTLLLNYANAPGLTKEALFRQMSIDALLIFNDVMSPDNMVNSANALYPTSLDLRNISFDSVMKLIMASGSTSASSTSVDAMQSVLADSDILTGLVLLLATFLSATFIPFMRDVTMGFLFYLLIFNNLRCIAKESAKKQNILVGFLMNNGVFIVISLAYYSVYKLLISSSNIDNVLSVSNITSTLTVSRWKFIIVLVIGIMYMMAIYKMLKFLWVNRYDMGYESYMTHATVIGGKVKGAVNGVRGKIGSSNRASAASSSVKFDPSDSMKADVKTSKENPLYVKSVDKDVNSADYNKANGNSTGDSGYYTGNAKAGSKDSSDINSEIEKGKKV